MKKVWIYLAITFGLTWTLWGVAFYSPLVETLSALGLTTVALSAGMFCPLIGALLTKLILLKNENISLKLLPNIKGHIRFYLLAWFAPTIMTLLGAGLYFLIFPSHFDPSMTMMTQTLTASTSSVDPRLLPDNIAFIVLVAQLALAITIAPFINMIFAFGEEAGWRAFLFPALSERMSQRSAVLVSGIIWGLWHAPATCVGHNYGLEYWGFPITGILCMCVFCVAVGSCLSYITTRVNSVWPAALAHGAINAVAGTALYFCLAPSSSFVLLGPAPTGLIGGIPLIILGAICWFKLSGTRPLPQPNTPLASVDAQQKAIAGSPEYSSPTIHDKAFSK